MRRLPAFLVVALATTAVAAPLAQSATATAKPPTVTILKGTFTDSAKYTGSGHVTVTRRKAARTIRVARDFRADPGAIRLRAYLATSPTGEVFIDLGPMRETGAHRYRVPAGVSLSRYRYLIAWCAAVDEPIAQAKLVRPRR